MHFSEFAKKIPKDRVYILYGDDEFLKQEGARHIEKTQGIPPDNISRFSVTKLDETSAELPKILDELYTRAFNRKQKLVIVNDASSALSKDTDWLKEYVKSPSENILVLLSDKKPALTEKCVWVECDTSEDDIISYTISLLNDKKVKATRDVVTEICQRCAFNLFVITTSIDKILSQNTQKKEITMEDVKANILDETQYDAFDLVSALTRNDTHSAIKILKRLLAEKVSLQAMIGAIAWQYRTAYEVKTLLERRYSFYKIAGELKVSTYRIEELGKTLCKLSFAELRKKLGILLEIDLMSKTTGEREEILGDILIFKLIKNGDRVLQGV